MSRLERLTEAALSARVADDDRLVAPGQLSLGTLSVSAVRLGDDLPDEYLARSLAAAVHEVLIGERER